MATRKIVKMSSEEKRWQREEDVRTLMRYQQIMESSARKNAAMAEAKRQAQDLEKRASLMNRASKGSK